MVIKKYNSILWNKPKIIAIITTDRLIEILDWYKNHGIKSIDKAIKQTEKNDLSYVSPERRIKFKGNSIINDVVHTKLRVIDKDIKLTGIDEISYSKRFNELTISYIDGKKIKKRGDEAMFQMINLTGYELFNLLNF